MKEELMNTVEENIETIELEPEVGINKLGLILGLGSLGLLGLAGAGVAFGIKKLKSKKDKSEDPEMVETEDTDDDFEDDSDSDEEKRELLENADVLMEAKKISRRTIVKLNKNDDLTRRTSMAALQLAKDNNDTLWKKLVKNRVQERKLLGAIKKKYANKAQVAARQGQRMYVQNGGVKPLSVHKLQPKEMSKTRV